MQAAYHLHYVNLLPNFVFKDPFHHFHRVFQGNEFEWILTAKMETRHPVEGYFGNEFPSICNHCRLKAAWSHKTLKEFKLFAFLEKRPLGENFQNSVPKQFITTPIDVLCSNSVKFGRREMVKSWVACLPKKNKFRMALQLSLLRGLRPKSA